MEKTIDAEKTLTLLAKLWADQYGQTIKGIKITRRINNEGNNNSCNNIASGY